MNQRLVVKRAFSLMELVLVIVVVGIISAVMVPRINDVQIDKAAQQVLTHIRYTQHLAMMDNRFDPQDPNWFKKRWQIRFQYKGSFPRKYFYTIYRDDDLTGGYSQREIAKNPLNPSQLLTGKKTISTVTTAKYTKKLDLYQTYNIKSVSMTGCIYRGVGQSVRLSFDYLGRPIVKNVNALARAYAAKTQRRLATKTCYLKLTDKSDRTATIAIEPETGYAYIYSIER